MTDSKIYSVLTIFDKIEQNRLRKYIHSPYFNVNETLMIFYDILIEHINKNGKAGTLVKESIWKKLYGKEAFNDVRFRKLGSDLLKLVEAFLAQEVYENSSMQQTSYLLEAVAKKKIDKLYNTSMRNAQLTTEQQHLKSADYYYYQYLIERNFYEISDVEMKRSEKSNIEKVINYLDEFYLAEKLKWYIASLTRKILISHDYKLLFIDEIVEHIKKHSYTHNSAISINYQILLTKIEPDNEDHYYKLIDLLERNRTKFPMEEQHSLYNSALNYCIQKLNQGVNKFVKEYHELFKFMLDKEIALASSNNNELSPWDFKNSILLALRLGEYDWTEKFIKNYRDKLPEDLRENAVSYNLALVYFYQKKYDKVIEQLREVEYEDLSYNLGSKSMLIAIFYEQDEFEALLSLADTFKTYLNRHKDINEKMRINYINYIQFVRKLTKLMPGDLKAIEQIRQEIKDAKGVASEKWLLEKLAELE